MSTTVKDGTGSCFEQKVDSTNMAWVRSVTESESVEANEKGDAYNINTGLITLTNADDTPILYIKNNETRSLFIEALAIGLYPSDAATGHVTATVIRNPTAGTIVSNATNVDINSNRNYGSEKTLTVAAYKGATGNTMTDGTDHLLINLGASGRSFITINEEIPQGTSMGVKIDPAVNNTSQQIYVAALAYLHRKES